MFKVRNVDKYSGLQATTFIQDLVKPTDVAGGCVVSATNLVANVYSGKE